MCKYCESSLNLINEWSKSERGTRFAKYLWIEGKKVWLEVHHESGSSFIDYVEINYCPFCGHEFREEENMELEKGMLYYEPKKDDRKPVKVIFEYNCIQVDGITPGGCPICPICEQPAYEDTHCVFCGVEFDRE